MEPTPTNIRVKQVSPTTIPAGAMLANNRQAAANTNSVNSRNPHNNTNFNHPSQQKTAAPQQQAQRQPQSAGQKLQQNQQAWGNASIHNGGGWGGWSSNTNNFSASSQNSNTAWSSQNLPGSKATEEAKLSGSGWGAANPAANRPSTSSTGNSNSGSYNKIDPKQEFMKRVADDNNKQQTEIQRLQQNSLQASRQQNQLKSVPLPNTNVVKRQNANSNSGNNSSNNANSASARRDDRKREQSHSKQRESTRDRSRERSRMHDNSKARRARHKDDRNDEADRNSRSNRDTGRDKKERERRSRSNSKHQSTDRRSSVAHHQASQNSGNTSQVSKASDARNSVQERINLQNSSKSGSSSTVQKGGNTTGLNSGFSTQQKGGSSSTKSLQQQAQQQKNHQQKSVTTNKNSNNKNAGKNSDATSHRQQQQQQASFIQAQQSEEARKIAEKARKDAEEIKKKKQQLDQQKLLTQRLKEQEEKKKQDEQKKQNEKNKALSARKNALSELDKKLQITKPKYKAKIDRYLEQLRKNLMDYASRQQKLLAFNGKDQDKNLHYSQQDFNSMVSKEVKAKSSTVDPYSINERELFHSAKQSDAKSGHATITGNSNAGKGIPVPPRTYEKQVYNDKWLSGILTTLKEGQQAYFNSSKCLDDFKKIIDIFPESYNGAVEKKFKISARKPEDNKALTAEERLLQAPDIKECIQSLGALRQLGEKDWNEIKLDDNDPQIAERCISKYRVHIKKIGDFLQRPVSVEKKYAESLAAAIKTYFDSYSVVVSGKNDQNIGQNSFVRIIPDKPEKFPSARFAALQDKMTQKIEKLEDEAMKLSADIVEHIPSNEVVQTCDTCTQLIKESVAIIGDTPTELRDLVDHKDILVGILSELEKEVNVYQDSNTEDEHVKQTKRGEYPMLLGTIGKLCDAKDPTALTAIHKSLKEMRAKLNLSLSTLENSYKNNVQSVVVNLKEKFQMCDKYGKEARQTEQKRVKAAEEEAIERNRCVKDEFTDVLRAKVADDVILMTAMQSEFFFFMKNKEKIASIAKSTKDSKKNMNSSKNDDTGATDVSEDLDKRWRNFLSHL